MKRICLIVVIWYLVSQINIVGVASSSVHAGPSTPTDNKIIEQVVVGMDKPSERMETCDYWIGLINEKTSNVNEQEWLKTIMICESMCRSYVKNPSSAAFGLFQFMPSTYYGHGGTDINNGSEQIDVALGMYREGQQKQWSCN